MATSPSEYRNNFRKTTKLKLPSGAEFEVRPFSLIDVVDSSVDFKNPNDPKLVSYIFTKCIINPIIVNKPVAECKENELSISEINSDDQMAIMKEVSFKSKTLSEDFLDPTASKF